MLRMVANFNHGTNHHNGSFEMNNQMSDFISLNTVPQGTSLKKFSKTSNERVNFNNNAVLHFTCLRSYLKAKVDSVRQN